MSNSYLITFLNDLYFSFAADCFKNHHLMLLNFTLGMGFQSKQNRFLLLLVVIHTSFIGNYIHTSLFGNYQSHFSFWQLSVTLSLLVVVIHACLVGCNYSHFNRQQLSSNFCNTAVEGSVNSVCGGKPLGLIRQFKIASYFF